MSETGKIIRGAGGHLKRNTSLGVGIGHPFGGEEGDIRVQMVNNTPKLYAKAGGQWYGISLQSEGGDELKISSSDKDYVNIKSDGVDIITAGTTAMSLTAGDIAMTGKISITSTGTDNVVMGTGNKDVGLRNIVLGVDAGAAMVEGNYNVDNILIGHNAGLAVTRDSGNNGSQNIFIGKGCSGNSESSEMTTTGTVNTLVGTDIAIASTVNYCSALGYNHKFEGHAGIALGSTCAVETYSIALGLGLGKINASNEFELDPVPTGEIWIGRSFDGVHGIMKMDYIGGSTAGAWTHSSDRRMKKNIIREGLGLDFINDLHPSKFEWKPFNEYPEEFTSYSDNVNPRSDKLQYGLIAQEVKEALDIHDTDNSFHGWSEDNDGSQRLAQGTMVTPLIKAVQELSTKMDIMQEEINNLKE